MDRKSGKQAVGRQYTGAEKAAVVADVAMLGLRGAGRLVGGEDPAGVGGIPLQDPDGAKIGLRGEIG